MSYDAQELEPKDVIRGWAGDTSNDPTSEYLTDVTYYAILARHGADVAPGDPTDTAPFYRAAAEILRRTVVYFQSRPSSISAPQDGSMSWSQRTTQLAQLAKELDAMAADMEADANIANGGLVTITNRFLIGGYEDEGDARW